MRTLILSSELRYIYFFQNGDASPGEKDTIFLHRNICIDVAIIAQIMIHQFTMVL